MHPNSPTRTKLDPNLIVAEVDGGRIAENILMFGRLLRAAGLPVGPEKVLRATEAVIATGIRDQATLYWALHAVFVNRRTEREIFNQAFVMFWKDPDFIDQMLSMMLPSLRANAEHDDKALSRRVSESLFKHPDRPSAQAEDQLEIDATGSFSAADVVRTKDFEQMSAAELAHAKRALSRLVLPFEKITTRRLGIGPHPFQSADQFLHGGAVRRVTAVPGPLVDAGALHESGQYVGCRPAAPFQLSLVVPIRLRSGEADQLAPCQMSQRAQVERADG